MKRKWLVLGGPALVLLAAGAGFAHLRVTGNLLPQPIAFNHRLHLERAQGITCQDCHQLAATHTYAGLPSKYVCFGCHDAEADTSDPTADKSKPALAQLMGFAGTERDIPWHRVTSLRPDVFFSHRRHVTVGKIACRTCHAGIPERTSPPTRGPITMPMNTCLQCHRKSNASTDCVSCHR